LSHSTAQPAENPNELVAAAFRSSAVLFLEQQIIRASGHAFKQIEHKRIKHISRGMQLQVLTGFTVEST
jgi:hypothetical protein